VRVIQSEDGVLLVDDSIAEKPYTDENEIICWHVDHAHQRTVKGINFVSCLYHNQGISLPVGFELITKAETYTDPQDGKTKRRSTRTKNEIYRDLVQQAVKNQIPFRYVLNDICSGSHYMHLFCGHLIQGDIEFFGARHHEASIPDYISAGAIFCHCGDGSQHLIGQGDVHMLLGIGIHGVFLA